MDVCLLWVLCWQVGVPAMGWSLFQRTPTETERERERESVCVCVWGGGGWVIECDQVQDNPLHLQWVGTKKADYERRKKCSLNLSLCVTNVPRIDYGGVQAQSHEQLRSALTQVTFNLRDPATLHSEEMPLVALRYEAKWIPKTVWTLWISAPAANQTPIPRLSSPFHSALWKHRML
jgi:hypothetical protein